MIEKVINELWDLQYHIDKQGVEFNVTGAFQQYYKQYIKDDNVNGRYIKALDDVWNTANKRIAFQKLLNGYENNFIK